ncbi:MAG: UDP-glucuronosyltransferase [Crenarchaeota archaeon]|nr:MAG: UDP-glucuronosyltransferase [Thermoproteota archaeon]RDJ33284.1 MAG: UDP-glucuronosyltransferase [Thermoproteota archaeon]RDJ36213.1 MAG: UDP-glucuronosyltransferase [Thermoproteota archaeon]RDJ38845.1 MAG: UDP-glucuronosyltransferase [Thermoproteota archaeon]
MTISFFSSPIGLGHASRDIAIAKYLNEFTIKFTSGTSAAKLIKKYGFGVNDAYVPPNFDVQSGSLQGSAKWLWQYYKYYKECKNISSEIIQDENPRVVVSDEDFASLTVAQERKIPTVLITDILETKFTNGIVGIIEKKMNKSMKEIIKKSDIVILPENGANEGNIYRVGPIVRETNHSREELREKFSFSKKTILLSIGGTDAGLYLIKKTIEATSKLGDFELVLVSGPSIKEEFKEIRNLGFLENLHEAIYAADVVVSLAGKSTIDEANAYGTPGIFIPIRNHFEQEDNAKEAGFSYDDIFKLDELIPKYAKRNRTPIQAKGAKNAAKLIAEITK